ncbi:MAG: hypothetical protein R3D44_11155 [Hyphomicrobiaceae bacterium]
MAKKGAAARGILVGSLTLVLLAACGQSVQQVLPPPNSADAAIGSAGIEPAHSQTSAGRTITAPPAPGAQTEAAATRAAPPRPGSLGLAAGGPIAERGRIVAFHKDLVTLYASETGADAERVRVSALTVPLRYRAASAKAQRVLIDTVNGPRWIATSEVTLGPSAK